MFKCPKCGNTDDLRIIAMVEVRVTQFKEDEFHDAGDIETEPVDGNHEWNDDSQMQCGACDHSGTVIEFDDDVIERLVALAESMAVEASDFDELIHEHFQAAGLDELNTLEDEDDQEDHISSREHDAADVNNGGLAAQFEYLLEVMTQEELEATIRRIAAENKK